MTANVEGLLVWVRAHPGATARATLSGGPPRRGVLELDRNMRAGQVQTRVVVRTDGKPDVVLSDGLIGKGAVEIRVGRRYVDARDVLAGLP